MKPLIKWSGGKTDEINNILPYIQDITYDTYIEPFVGGGALYFHLCPPQRAVIADTHHELINFYKCIKDGRASDIYKYMQTHPNTESVYYEVRDGTDGNDTMAAARFYYLRKTAYRGMLRYNKAGRFNVPYGRYKHITYDNLSPPLINEYEALLRRTDILESSFERIFEMYNDASNFMFLDPPYDSVFTNYGGCANGQFDTDSHKKLAHLFKTTKNKCLMVIGKTDLTFDLYKDHIVGEYPKKYRFKLHSGRIDDKINTTHLVVCNYAGAPLTSDSSETDMHDLVRPTKNIH